MKILRTSNLSKYVRAVEASRAEGGFSLPTVLAMGVVTTLFVSALFSALMPVYQKVANLRSGTTVRAAAEGGLDYVLGQLNTFYSDPTHASSTSAMETTAIPCITDPNITGDPSGRISVDVAIAQLNNPPHSSMLWDQTLATTTDPRTLAMFSNRYKQVTSTARFGAVQKTIRVMLAPVPVVPSDTGTGGTPGTQDNDNSFDDYTQVLFPYSAFGTSRVELVGQAGINSYNTNDPRLYCDIGTFGAGNQVGTGSTMRGIAQGGSQLEFPNPLSFQTTQIQQTAQTYNATPVSQAPWCHILGDVFSNGDTTGYWPRGSNTATSHPWNNVFGSANGVVNGAPDGAGGTVPVNASPSWSGGLVTSYSSYPKPSVPAAPQAPPGTPNLGSISLSNNATLSIDPSASLPSGTIGSITSGTVRIPPGDYIVNSISMTGSSQIVIDSSAGPTRLFLQGASSGSQAVSTGNSTQINMSGLNGATGFDMGGQNGQGFPNTTPGSQLGINRNTVINENAGTSRQLQMYYSGTQNIYLTGNERMTVYAPNATINIGAQPVTHDANFYGAAVGAVTRVISSFNSGGGAFLHYDGNLRPPGQNFIDPTNPPNVFNVPRIRRSQGGIPGVGGSHGQSVIFGGYRAVTWQEI